MTIHENLLGSDVVRLPDGRWMGFLESGDAQGYPLFFCHGMPGSRLQGRYFNKLARELGFRIITPDRPGIGMSSPYGKRCLRSDGKDICDLADLLSIREFGVFGWSSGGPVALATAWRAPERLSFVASIAGFTNFAEYPEGRFELLRTGWPLPKIAQWSERLFRGIVKYTVQYARWWPESYYRHILRACGDYDQDLLQQPESGQLFLRDQLEVIHSSTRAIADDLATQHEDWGFRLRDIPSPVLVLQGAQDRFVPVALAEHLADSLPQGHLHLFPEFGHMFPLDQSFQRSFFQLVRAWITTGRGSERQEPGRKVTGESGDCHRADREAGICRPVTIHQAADLFLL